MSETKRCPRCGEIADALVDLAAIGRKGKVCPTCVRELQRPIPDAC